MKKKWVFIVIALLLIAGIGGKIYMDKREEQIEAEKIEAERMSVIALKKRYANIKSVEIKKSGYDKMTGAFDVTIKMTNDKNESANFTYPFWPEEGDIGAILTVDKKVQIKGETTKKIQVIYSNKKEGDV